MKSKSLFVMVSLLVLVVLFSCKKDKDDDIVAAATSLYFIDYSTALIQKLTLDGNGTLKTVKNIVQMTGVGIAYDTEHNKIFFSDLYNGKIWKMNIDGSGSQTLVSGIYDPYGVALDVAGGKVYWVDDEGQVSRSNLDGTSFDPGFIKITNGRLRAIGLDKANNKLYFNDINEKILYTSKLDGTGVTKLIEGAEGYAIKIDNRNSKIYFDDQNGPGLFRANIDGTGIEEIDNTVARIYGIEIDSVTDKLYWSAREMGEIYKSNLNGTEKETLLTGLISPRGIFIK